MAKSHPALEDTIHAALAAKVPPREILEIILQCVVYGGHTTVEPAIEVFIASRAKQVCSTSFARLSCRSTAVTASARTMRGALRQGAHPREVLEVIFQTCVNFGMPPLLEALEVFVGALAEDGRLDEIGNPPRRVETFGK